MNRFNESLNSAIRSTAPAHFNRWLIASCIALLAYLCIHTSFVRDSRVNPAVTIGMPQVIHNGEIKDGQVWIGPNAGPHAEIAWEVELSPQRTYIVAMMLDNETKYMPAVVYVDFDGEGYHDPGRRFATTVPAGMSDHKAVGTLSSDAAPRTVWLRVFHLDRARLRVHDVSVREISRIYKIGVVLTRAGVALALVGLLLSAMRFMQAKSMHLLRADRSATILWIAAILGCFFVVIVTNSLLGPPQIFGDEYAYWATTAAIKSGDWAALRDTHYQEFPNRLFFALYQVTTSAKDPFVAARVLNAAWLMVALLVIYALCRETGVVLPGVVVAIAYGIGPLASYTAYFMPETLFATIFIAGCALGAMAIATGTLWAEVGCGIAFSALTYVKPNAWIVVAATFPFFLVVAWRGRKSESSFRGRDLAIVAASFVGSWMLFNLVLPDVPARAQFFGMYSGLTPRVLDVLKSPSKLSLALQLFKTHLALIASLAGPALLYGIYVAVRPTVYVEVSRQERVARALAGLVAVSLVGLVAMTAVFSAAFAGTSETEATRLHTRYYNFALPLLVLAFIGAPVAREWGRMLTNVALSIWAVACVVALLALPAVPHMATFIDGADLSFGKAVPRLSVVAFGAIGLVIAIMLRRAPRGLKLGVLAAYAVSALVSGQIVRVIQLSWGELAENRAALFAVALAEETRVPIIILTNLAEGQPWPYRVASYAPTRTRFMRPDQLSAALADGLPPEAILIASEKDLPPSGLERLARFNDFAIARMAPKQQ